MFLLRKERVTIRDIAREAGVSISVVSYVLNDVKGKSISDEVKKKIKDIAEELKYIPNRNAAILRSGKSKVIGIISYWSICDTLSSFIDGIRTTAGNMGYRVLYYPFNGVEDSFDYINDFNDHLVDGVVFIAPCESIGTIDINEHINRMLSAGMPFTMISELTYGYDNLVNTIFLLDYYQTTYSATEYYIRKGETDITYISERFYYMAENERLKGYLDCMAKYGLKPKKYSISEIGENLKDFNAVITNKCDTAHELYKIANVYGIKIPEQLQVISANTEIYSPFMIPPITSVNVSGREIATEATKSLIAKLDGKSYTPKEIIYPIDIRKSTK